MSDTEAACYTVAITLALVGLAIYLMSRAYAEHLDRRARRSYLQANWDEANKRWSDNDGHDVGPDPLRLQQDLDAHLDAHFARLKNLFEELGSPPAHTADDHTNHQGDHS